MISPNVHMISPDVLNIPQCTHGIPHMHHDILQCTEHPPPRCTHGTLRCTHDIPTCTEHPRCNERPNVLNIPQCTEHTLYKVILCSYQVHKWKYSSFFLFNCEFMHF